MPFSPIVSFQQPTSKPYNPFRETRIPSGFQEPVQHGGIHLRLHPADALPQHPQPRILGAGQVPPLRTGHHCHHCLYWHFRFNYTHVEVNKENLWAVLLSLFQLIIFVLFSYFLYFVKIYNCQKLLQYKLMNFTIKNI